MLCGPDAGETPAVPAGGGLPEWLRFAEFYPAMPRTAWKIEACL
ncbi:MAG: hypothetical protein [Olavius algarvensis Gamma 1 endosymbiont]|nr:MAG: hypothetical protein [Olavius algarvensis Gamma 1 endosymbiont]